MPFDTGKSVLRFFETLECLIVQDKGKVSKHSGNVEFENPVAQVMDFKLHKQARGSLRTAG